MKAEEAKHPEDWAVALHAEWQRKLGLPNSWGSDGDEIELFADYFALAEACTRTLAQQEARAAALEEAAQYIQAKPSVSALNWAEGIRGLNRRAAGQPEGPSKAVAEVHAEWRLAFSKLPCNDRGWKTYCADCSGCEHLRALLEGK